ncbi:caspase family protein [Lacinutrix chionoecetis]
MAKRSLTVGINNYSILDPRGRANLSACVADARSMYHLLKNSFGFTDLYHLEDLNASKTRIIDTLRHLINISEAGDTICFYFSGHGSRQRSDMSAGDCDKYYEALVPASGGWITDRDLKQITEDLYPDAVNFTIITDACNSGGMHSADDNIKCRTPTFSDDLLNTIASFLNTLIPCGICVEDTSQLNNNVSNVENNNGNIDLDPDPNKILIGSTKSTLLSACHFNELSWETRSIGHGIFTKAILESVTQSNMEITYHDFMDTLQANVADKIRTLINPGRPGVTQTPQLFGQRNRMGENFLQGWIETPLEM